MSLTVEKVSVGPNNCPLNFPLRFQIKFKLERTLCGSWRFEYVADSTRRRHVVLLGVLEEREYSSDDEISFEVGVIACVT